MDKEKPLKLNPNLQPVGANAIASCDDVINQIQNYENYYKTRTRARKQNDQLVFEQIVSCIVSNLVLSVIQKNQSGIRISRSHSTLGTKDRYRSAVLSTTFPDVVDTMLKAEMSFLRQEKAKSSLTSRRAQSLIFPSDKIENRVSEFTLSIEDFAIADFPEVIVLKTEKEDYFTKANLMQYTDSAVSNKLREEILTLNDWLVTLDIEISDNVRELGFNSNNRKLKRYFSCGDQTFSSGGRLFGGFWLDMSKELRRDYLWLEDENICYLDIENLAPTILYSMVGETPPKGDAYVVPGYEMYRDGIKSIFNSMTFSKTPITRFPKGMRKVFTDTDHRIGYVLSAIRKKHPAIFELLNSEVGYKIQKAESDILIKAMLMAKNKDVACLPVHDALLFPQSKKEEGKRILLDAIREITGVEGSVNEEL